MMQAQHRLILTARNCWKRYLIDALLALLTAVPVIILVLPLHWRLSKTTALLIYLCIVFLLVHKRRLVTAILVTLIACVVVDFFLIAPVFSFNIYSLEESLDLVLFLLFELAFIYLYSQSQKQAEKAKQQEHVVSALYEEKLHQQAEETSRREREWHIFSDIVREIRDEKDLKRQLSLIAQAIDDTFSPSGIQGCIFLLPDLEGKSLQPMIATQSTDSVSLSREEEASADWVMQHRKTVELRTTPLIARTRGSYLRWMVTGNAMGCADGYASSYIVPLLSGPNVIGAVRLLVADTTHPRFVCIKKSLEMQIRGVSDPQPDLFFELLQYAVLLIEQVLIERALRQQEEWRTEKWHRTEELYRSIISSVSHDFKTPLTLIKGAAGSLLDGGEIWNDEAERRSLLAEIVSEANWLELIITRMLDLSRIEQGMLKPEKELYPIETIVLNTLELGHISTLLQGRRIEKSGLEELPPVDVDPIMIGQVFGNLLENAARHTPAGLPIEINGQTDGGQIIMSIIDHGPGIPPREKERIFEKFYRISRKMEESEDTAPLNDSSVPPVQGFGIGLTVCQGLVEAHEGRIWVENLDGGGAKFQFTLPLRQAEGRGIKYEEDPCR